MNFCKKSIFLFAHLIHLIAAWNYGDVDQWENEYPLCGGSQQSPVNLNDLKPGADNVQSLKFRRYHTFPQNMTMRNTGRTVEIKPDWTGSRYKTPVVIKNNVEYEIVLITFHWGSSDDSGSEHLLNNAKTPLEMHVIHWNPKLGSFDPQKGEGILIISQLFKGKKYQGDTILDYVANYLPSIEEPDSTPVDIPPFAPKSVFIQSLSLEFIYYTGSLTSPPCSEGVSWLVMDKLGGVDERQMQLFRATKFSEGDDHNNRPIQSVNERVASRLERNY